jgi:putative ABC transport system permease protein
MLINYFKTLFRNFVRNKTFTLINVSGLTLGITCSLVMFLIVKQEFSFNQYHANIDSIYRIGHIDIDDGREYSQGGVPLVMPASVKEEIVGVKDVTLISHQRYGLISVNDGSEIKYYEEEPELTYIEPSFFDIFDWTVLEGSVATAFSEPNMVALNKTLADKYFPNQSALGQTIKLDKALDLKVVAVLEDAPKNSDFPFGIFISMETKRAQKPEDFDQWGSISSENVAFVLLEDNVSAQQVEEQWPTFIEKHWDKDMREVRSFVLAPFAEYHFDEQFGTFSGRVAPKTIMYAYTIIGILLIVTACFNFINMSTAMAVKRAKEVGMRKVLGSTRQQLVLRFLGETFAITLISLLLSMAITERLLPLVINDFIGIDISFHPLVDLGVFAYLMVILISVSLLAGLYPAIVLSSAKPINALKGGMTKGRSNLFFRRSLVFGQFLICQVLIFGTVVALQQMEYFNSVDMGYDQEYILNIDLAERDEASIALWESKIQNIPGVIAHSFSYKPPFSGSQSVTNVFYYGQDSTVGELNTHVKMADDQYQKTYGIKLIAGDWLVKSDTVNQFVVNETYLKKLGIADPYDAIGKRMKLWGMTAPIVGVVKDYHVTTLSQAIEPVTMFNMKEQFGTLGMRINGQSTAAVLAEVETIWSEIHEEYEFDYNFLDEQIKEFYSGEREMSQMLTVFAFIAIFIGCLGLYGLVSFMANQKAKEIGIRKVLGATVAHLMGRFSLEFIVLVGISFLFAAPLAFYGMNSWLDQYEYRIVIGPIIFIISIGASMLIALGTTGYRSMRAATANPVNSLRDE